MRGKIIEVDFSAKQRKNYKLKNFFIRVSEKIKTLFSFFKRRPKRYHSSNGKKYIR